MEEYLDSFQVMQKATENVLGDTTIADAMDDDNVSLLLLSKTPFTVPADGKEKDVTEENNMESTTKESSMKKKHR